MHELLHDIAFCIIAAWALGMVAQHLRQPVILAYLVGGFALGPAGFGWIKDKESVATIAELGLIFLLFMIGLEIDLKKLSARGARSSLLRLRKSWEDACSGFFASGWWDFRLAGGNGMRSTSASPLP